MKENWQLSNNLFILLETIKSEVICPKKIIARDSLERMHPQYFDDSDRIQQS
jgi:hypothetical protein